MPLKNLMAQKAVLTEDAIEALVSDFIRYDVDEKDIAFTPAAVKLSNKAKVLTYLVALQGWPFVLDEVVPTAAKPAHIEDRVAIHGGSLRPILKDLKDRHLIIVKNGEYSVRPSSISAIQSELEGAPSAPPKSRRPKRRGQASKEDDDAVETDSVSAMVDSDKSVGLKPEKKKRATGKNGGAAAEFELWIENGFFAEARTLSDVQQRFHKEAIMIPRTSIPKMLLGAVKRKKLSRDKAEVGGKLLWVYVRK